MNFLREKSLKQIGAYALVLMVLVFLGQYFILRAKVNQLHEATSKIDFARSAQSKNQKLCLRLQSYLYGSKESEAAIISLINDHNHRLTILSEGGRIDGTQYFIKPLGRLPGITFRGLIETWKEYKSVGLAILSGTEANNEPMASAPVDSLAGDSISNAAQASLSESKDNHVRENKMRFNHEALAISLSSWYDKLIVDLEEETENKKSAVTHWLILLVILNSILFAGVYYVFNKHVLLPVKAITKNTASNVHTFGLPKNEIGLMAESVNNTIENLKDATDFITSIGQGNLNIDYKEALDNNYERGTNVLADSLIDMQARLRELKAEEEKHQWANEGLTRFVDILRSSADNVTVLCDQIIAELVRYTKSNQGGLYLINDEDPNHKYLDLVALFAFDTRKYDQQKVKPGEGILGQTFLERQTTYLTNVPQDYVRITSGLGGSNPKSVLIVPLKTDYEVYGLVELASFHEYLPHEIAFVERLSETIASTLATVRSAQKNRFLIEQFQQQTEEMRAQEEEMRQNMEELQATQEEIARKERGYLERIRELESAIGSAALSGDYDSAKELWSKNEQDYKLKIELLEKTLAQKTAQADEWEIAQELNKALQINLEALRITQEEMGERKI